MENILKDVNAVVGVTGSFVCSEEGEVLARLMPNIFDDASLSPVGRTIAQTIAGLKITRRRKIGDIDLLFDQGRLIVKSAGAGCLCILCTPRVNVPLLNLTANLAAKKLGEQMKSGSTVKKAVMKSSAPSPKPEPETRFDLESTPEAEAEPEPTRRVTRAELMAKSLRR